MSDSPAERAAARQPGPLVAGPAPLVPRSKRRRSLARRLAYWIAVPAADVLLRILARTRRASEVLGREHFEGLVGGGHPCIIVCWHADGVTCVTELFRLVSEPGLLTYMVSPSVDGDPVSALLERYGARVVRGSATRSAVGSLRHLYRSLSGGGVPVIFPDGPTGPPQVYKAGALLLSQLARAPVLPMACAVDRRWRLGSWDRLVLPKPFSRSVTVFGEPYLAPQRFAEGELEEACVLEGRRLEELGRAARERLA